MLHYRVLRAGGFGPHTDDELAQLTWMRGAVLRVLTDRGVLVVPSNRAVWIPAGRPHDVVATGPGDLYCLYTRASDPTLDTDEPTVLEVDDLLRGLIGYLAASRGVDAALRARAVLLDALRAAARDPDRLALPADPRARAVARRVLDDPATAGPLESLAAGHGISARTVRRLFVDQVGMTFRDWAVQARLFASLPLLAEDLPVTEIAHRVGYATPSGYVAAFRERFGCTPGAYRSGMAT